MYYLPHTAASQTSCTLGCWPNCRYLDPNLHEHRWCHCRCWHGGYTNVHFSFGRNVINQELFSFIINALLAICLNCLPCNQGSRCRRLDYCIVRAAWGSPSPSSVHVQSHSSPPRHAPVSRVFACFDARWELFLLFFCGLSYSIVIKSKWINGILEYRIKKKH